MPENEDFFLKRISELERSLHKTADESKRRKLLIRKMTAEMDGIKSERDALNAQLEDSKQRPPDEWEVKYRAKEKEVWKRDHVSAWKDISEQRLLSGVPLEEIWSKIGYEPGEAVPTPEQVQEHLEKAKAVVPYLFRVDGQTQGNPTKPASQNGTQQPDGSRGRLSVSSGVDLSRGSRSPVPGEYVVSKRQLRDPNFFRLNQKSINEASRNNTLVVTDD